MPKYKALIRVVKCLTEWNFGSEEVHREPLIEAESKDEVKKILLEKFPNFFPNGKVYQRQTKDEAQFFYVLIYELYQHEINHIEDGNWECDSCGQVHENKYVSSPHMNRRIFGDKLFCSRVCESDYMGKNYDRMKGGDEIGDNLNHIRKESPNYIYKITEKKTGKCYIGKTRNEPVWRWWDHLKKSVSPFGVYLRSRPIDEWTFEVIDILPSSATDKEVFKKESEYIIEFDSIQNGFNTTISDKSVLKKSNDGQTKLQM